MSFKKYAPLLWELKHSKHLIRVMGFIHVLALLTCIMNSLPVFIKSLLLVAIGSHYYWQSKQLTAKQYCIKHSEASGWELSEGNEFVTVTILPSTVISTVAVFLHIKKDSKPRRQHLIIACDSLADDDYRSLIVRLKTTLCEKENDEV